MNKQKRHVFTKKKARIYCRGQKEKKNLNGYKILGKSENYKVTVKPYHGATIRCLEDYVKPVLQENPDEIIFNIGTNNLPSGKGNKNIAEAIVNRMMSVKTIIWYFNF